jgi:hypothetical protein
MTIDQPLQRCHAQVILTTKAWSWADFAQPKTLIYGNRVLTGSNSVPSGSPTRLEAFKSMDLEAFCFMHYSIPQLFVI